MSPKRLKQIGAVLVALVVLWGISALLLRQHSDSLGGWSVPNLAKAGVDSISIVGTGDTLAFVRQDSDHWSVNGWKTHPNAVKELLADLDDTTGAQLVAQSTAAQTRLQVDSASGYRVRVHAGGRMLLDMFVGKNGQAYGSTYVRRVGDRHIYLVQRPLNSMAHRVLYDWRDRTIARITRDSTGSVHVRAGRQAYTLTRDSDVWHIGAHARADSDAVAQLFDNLGDVSAVGFATRAERDSISFRHPARQLLVQGRHGHTLADLDLVPTRDGYWVRSAGDSVIYRISHILGTEITPADSVFRPRHAAPHHAKVAAHHAGRPVAGAKPGGTRHALAH